ncbi:helix-turn-helix domain-containing protein [Rhodobaculum claviforme]|uniref:Transcriptional regulator n=1 Tax=Rhodobaculum claviforme TaxID=1549854 RepID=A0A934WHX6_9RHOB|nr:helix-turn-helix transcriptional regulator [Rhodobaculum claviforme]MBK5927600.1 transcriptional regulator [Rhodobaculum claviforme]
MHDDSDADGWFGAQTATLGDRVAGAREAAGKTRAELARGLGVRLSTIEAWEEDRAEPRANKLQMAAGVLNVSVGWLLTGVGDGPDGPPEGTARPDDAHAALSELRRTRAELGTIVTRLARAEARLARILREDT